MGVVYMKPVCGYAGTCESHGYVFSYRLHKRKGTFACLGVVSQIKVTFQVHNPAQQDQGRP
jgi:hypothetical protein